MNKPINLTEIIVEQVLNERLAEQPGVCNCQKCKYDMMAYALNHLTPRYVVTDKGEALARAMTLNNQVTTDFLVEVSKAIKQISENPRHNEN